jgi:hypothetical protein
MAVVAAAFLVLAATRGPLQGRPEWQAWLDARSSTRVFPAPESGSESEYRAVHPVHPSRLVIPRPEDDDLPPHP